MAAGRIAGSAVDMAVMYKACPKHQIEQLRELRSRINGIANKVSALPESLPKINWDQYRSIPNQAIVDHFRQQYEKLQIPYPKDVNDSIGKLKLKSQHTLELGKRHLTWAENMLSRLTQLKTALQELPEPKYMDVELMVVYFPHFDKNNFQVFVDDYSPPDVISMEVPKVHWDFD